jgi:DNA-binding CsgD family transcriptional regulator
MDLSTDDAGAAWRKAALAAGFAAVAGLAGVDLLVDLGAGTTARHALLESATVLVGVVLAGVLLVRIARDRRRLQADAASLRSSLALSHQDAERWRREASKWTQGLGQAIDAQLAAWGLTPAEAEIALLLLKGLSHKEIAQLRGVAESSVRQQARAVYRKAHLQGRTELAAFFLEDLLAPRGHE